MARVIARRREGYTHDVEIEGGHEMVIDEPREKGGNDAGPAPTRVLGAALASCTAITVEMYADRKGWAIADLRVDVDITYDGHVPVKFEVTLRCTGDLDDEQYERLRVIASKCPVHKALAAGAEVDVIDRVVPG